MTGKKKSVKLEVRPDGDAEERDDAVIGVAFRWSLVVIGALVIAGAATVYWVTRPPAKPPVRETKLAPAQIRTAAQVEPPSVMFKDITAEAGLHFRHENGAYGDKLLPETMGGGCALFDFDNDGDLDILCVNSQRWLWDPRPAAAPAIQALYRNDGQGRFDDVTAGSGLDVSLYGMGVAIGDYDNDGLADVFLSAVGTNRLFHNEGEGRFLDVTAIAGVGGGPEEWSSSCGWFDFDNDGDLDLFVCNYVKWSKDYDLAQDFQLTGGGRAYGRPQDFEGTFPYLYRNDGGGKFADISAEAGIQVRNPATQVPMAKSLGVTFADLDGDGWLDIVVANDTVQNFLFRNRGDGTFEECGALAGIAFDAAGNARGAMGIDAACFRNDDSLGVAIGNFANEMSALYVSRSSELQFTDEAVSSGLGPPTRLELTFGVVFLDYDLDGRLDLAAANGHLEDDINKVQPSQHYEQPPHLFWNCGSQFGTEFMPIPEAKCGADFARPMVGRGSAVGDIDGDGDLDLLVMATGQPPRLLRNDQQLKHHWLQFQLTGDSTCNRDSIGAWVEIEVGGQKRRQQVMPTRSYLSQSSRGVTFGLGSQDKVDRVTVYWPDGTAQMIDDIQLDRRQVIVKGQTAQSTITTP